jgi:hypothetical protein
MVLRRSIHLTLAHGSAWSACRSECLVITKVGRLIFAALRTAISGDHPLVNAG